jgi:hypothetical protein
MVTQQARIVAAHGMQMREDVLSYLPRIYALCQDTDSGVRLAAAGGLGSVAAGLVKGSQSSCSSSAATPASTSGSGGSELSDVCEELTELLADEETQVGCLPACLPGLPACGTGGAAPCMCPPWPPGSSLRLPPPCRSG